MARKSFTFGNHSDVGMVRKENQDYFGYFTTTFGELFIVCDGMGGYQGGSTASRLAVEAVKGFLANTDITDPGSALAAALHNANKQVYQKAQTKPEYKGMGTTAVALLIQPGSKPKGWVAHVGDSRLYRVRAGKIERVTRDHSKVQEMVDHGIITQDEAEDHRDSNIISRAIGKYEKTQPDVSPVDICRGDRYILCTDGVSGPLKDDDILELSKKNKSPQDLSEALIDTANERGGDDNSTAQVIDIHRGPISGETKKSLLKNAVITVGAAVLVFAVIVSRPWTWFAGEDPPAYEEATELHHGFAGERTLEAGQEAYYVIRPSEQDSFVVTAYLQGAGEAGPRAYPVLINDRGEETPDLDTTLQVVHSANDTTVFSFADSPAFLHFPGAEEGPRNLHIAVENLKAEVETEGPDYLTLGETTSLTLQSAPDTARVAFEVTGGKTYRLRVGQNTPQVEFAVVSQGQDIEINRLVSGIGENEMSFEVETDDTWILEARNLGTETESGFEVAFVVEEVPDDEPETQAPVREVHSTGSDSTSGGDEGGESGDEGDDGEAGDGDEGGQAPPPDRSGDVGRGGSGNRDMGEF